MDNGQTNETGGLDASGYDARGSRSVESPPLYHVCPEVQCPRLMSMGVSLHFSRLGTSFADATLLTEGLSLHLPEAARDCCFWIAVRRAAAAVRVSGRKPSGPTFQDSDPVLLPCLRAIWLLVDSRHNSALDKIPEASEGLWQCPDSIGS